MNLKYSLNCDRNKWYASQKNYNIAYNINADNVFTLRVEAYLWVYDANFLEFTKTIADIFTKHLEPGVVKELPPEMVKRRFGQDFGFTDYIN